MKTSFIVVLSDLDTDQYQAALSNGEIGMVDPVIHQKKKPDFFDILSIDHMDHDLKEWKHVLRVAKSQKNTFEIIEYITCYGRTFSNF